MSCIVCKKTTSSRCARCHQIYYCGRDCQRQNWSEHKEECFRLETKNRIELGNQMLAMSPDQPERKAMADFYANLSKEDLLDVMMTDPHYVQRKKELDELLTAQVVRSLFDSLWNNSQTLDLQSTRGVCLLFGSTQAIVRAIKKQEQKGDFLELFPLTLTELNQACPHSEALRTHQNDPSILFITVAHAFPLKMLRSDLDDFTIHHSLTAIKKDLLKTG